MFGTLSEESSGLGFQRHFSSLLIGWEERLTNFQESTRPSLVLVDIVGSWKVLNGADERQCTIRTSQAVDLETQ